MTTEIATTILPPGYLEHEQKCLSAGERVEASMYEFLDACLAAKRDLGEAYWQLQATVCRKRKIKEKTLSNYLGTYENSLEGQWHVPALSISHHTAVDLKDDKWTAIDKEETLTAALENCLPVEETRALARELLAQKKGLPSPIEKEMTAMEELQDALDVAQTRVAEAVYLLKESLVYAKRADDTDLAERIDDWLRAE